MFSLLAMPQIASSGTIRTDFVVISEPGIELFVRQVVDEESNVYGAPILLLHGARVGSIPSFDVDVPGFSLAEDLSKAGYTVYLADLRGYGNSTFPPMMERDRFSTSPAVTTDTAIIDVKAVLDAVSRRHPNYPINAMGWATGSHWLAATEASYPGSIQKLIFYNSIYSGDSTWNLTESFSKKDEPGVFDYEKFGSYRLSDAKSLIGRWMQADNISQEFIDRYISLSMEGDPTSESRSPASFRHPSGAIADMLKIVNSGSLYDAGRIQSNVLILRSGDDFWSRAIDVSALKADLTNAASIVTCEMKGVSHYVHLEPGAARTRLIKIVMNFFADSDL